MSTLYLVSTPIGNLADLSPRAEETLRSVQRILAEDTRRTRILADRAGTSARLVSVHAHNERERTERILKWLGAGEDLALVSDAGTPLVSDPGARIVGAVVDAGHQVVPVPGASAVLAALVASGLPTERFSFVGFPERKGPDRTRVLDRIARSEDTVVLFESPRRLKRLLQDLQTVCEPERHVAVARELTKVHEEIWRGTLAEAVSYYDGGPPKGEVTVVVAPSPSIGEMETDIEAVRQFALKLLADGASASSAAKQVADRLDVPRNEAYRIVHELDLETHSE